MTRRRWTKNEKLKLVELYPAMLNAEIAVILNRTKEAIDSIGDKLGLRKDYAVFKGRGARNATQHLGPQKAYFAAGMMPDKPTQRPEDAMRGVRYEDVSLKRGRYVNGNAMARYIAGCP